MGGECALRQALRADGSDGVRRALTEQNIDDVLRQEVGAVFARVLADAGVYKCAPASRAAFVRFAEAAGAEVL